MLNLKRPSRNDLAQCKRHPKHKQSPGVCSLCLNEKLAFVSKTRPSLDPPRRRTTDSASSSSSSSSSSSAEDLSSCSSSYSSPIHHRYRFNNNTRERRCDMGSLVFDDVRGVLPKSRSMAFVPRSGNGDYFKKDKERGHGFWSKLLNPRRKKIDNGLVHSKTMRERVIAVS